MSRSLESRFAVTFRPDGSLEVVSFDATGYNASTLEIPAEISGRPVKAVKIIFSETDDLELESIVLPDGLERVDDGMFEYCNKLNKIVIPEGVREIGKGAFASCSALTQVVIPAGVRKIGYNAFASCSALTQVVIPASVREIGESAFSHCSALTQVVIPASVREIGESAFERCDALRNVDVSPENPRFKSVDGVLFDAETKTLLHYPADKDATVYRVPDGVEQIGCEAFAHAKRLVEVRLPTSLKHVEYQAFFGCDGLTEILLPPNLEWIDGSAFAECSRFTQFNVDPAHPFFESVDGVLFDARLKTLRAFPVGQDATVYRVPDGVERVGLFAFSHSTRLTEILFPESLRNVDDFAFSHCSNLTRLDFPSGLRQIARTIVAACSALDEIRIPASVKKIDKNAFSASLTSSASDALTLIVDAGSEAERFARAAGIRFQLADDLDDGSSPDRDALPSADFDDDRDVYYDPYFDAGFDDAP